MLPFLQGEFGNPNSIHSLGGSARDAVESARVQVASLIGAEDPSQIYFTAGASEANNWVAHSTRSGIVSPFEHSSMQRSAETCGWAVWPNSGEALIDPGEPFEVASLMTVNNETGDIWDIRDRSIDANALHADATQIVGKLPFDVTGLNFASMSAHKLYGPKGIGALYCWTAPPTPLMFGGEQEGGFRAGTLNVPAIVGFGAAAEIVSEEMAENELQARKLREILLHELSRVSDFRILGGPKTSPFILCLAFLGVEGETLVVEVDRQGYAISSGAACSSRSNEPSHVLQALDVPTDWLRGAVRISFGKMNTEKSTVGLAECLTQSVEKLRTMTRAILFPRNVEHGIERL
jgi:cysteine desulfurase